MDVTGHLSTVHIQEAKQIPRGYIQEYHTKTHYKQTVESQKQESWKQQDKQLIIYKWSPIRKSIYFSAEAMELEGCGMTYLKYKRKNPSIKNYIPSKTILQNIRVN